MLRVEPEVATAVAGDVSRETIERVIAHERDVNRLVDKRMFDSVFATIERADLADSPLTFEANTWNSVCWFASLYGHAEQAMPACEAAVAPDTTVLYIRDSRGLARALVGDTQGAIDDFRYAVEGATNEEFVSTRSAWLEALLAGENPFTGEVLKELRESEG
jgi:hypothetical protein